MSDDIMSIHHQYAPQANELFERDQIDELIRYTEGVLSHAPNNLQARYFLGLAYYRNRDYRSALREFNAVIALNPAWRDDPIGPFLHEIEEHGLAAEPPARKH